MLYTNYMLPNNRFSFKYIASTIYVCDHDPTQQLIEHFN